MRQRGHCHPLALAGACCAMLLCASARAEMGVAIGISPTAYPELVPVPGYPVYYDPRADSNYFFYDGEYWVYTDDTWYASSWYNGPWQRVGSEDVPLFRKEPR